ncbi:hypothetical protein CDAR_112961 [Caerostris darwini]|uniref:Uncharacterized protein n=1 Tax=Caerostris darwini TaxID=1538125 RepID=A0AAV4Q2T0_9ARAC|nr:hypothetical protein CDAR_112961 [Caerostris darwini]
MHVYPKSIGDDHSIQRRARPQPVQKPIETLDNHFESISARNSGRGTSTSRKFPTLLLGTEFNPKSSGNGVWKKEHNTSILSSTPFFPQATCWGWGGGYQTTSLHQSESGSNLPQKSIKRTTQ